MSRGTENERFLLCRIGTSVGAFDLRCVQETLRPLPVKFLGGAPFFVLGVSILRGVPTPVIDVERLLGSETATSATSTIGRFVALKVGARQVALAVAAVLDVRSLPSPLLADVPRLLGDASATMLSAVGALDSELLMVLETSRMVPESLWAALDASRLSA